MRTGRTVLVTGAASGIGLEIARHFVAGGDRVVLVDRHPQVEDIANALGGAGAAIGMVCDIADEPQLLDTIERLKAAQGGCDVLVNCAGIAPSQDGQAIPLAQVSTADWNRVLQVNLTAPFILCRELLPGMQARGFSRVVNIASITGRTFRPRAGIDYATSKAGLMGLTRRLAGEYAPFGITINSVAPGRVQTPLSAKSAAESAAIARQTIPMQRSGTTAEVAAAVCFLASVEAAYITGTCLDVNGGDFIG